MVQLFKSKGAEIVGPTATVEDALDLIDKTEHIDAAVLDVNLQGEMAFLVADALLARGVPFVFATGYDKTSIPSRYAHVIRCEKPVGPDQVAKALFG